MIQRIALAVGLRMAITFAVTVTLGIGAANAQNHGVQNHGVQQYSSSNGNAGQTKQSDSAEAYRRHVADAENEHKRQEAADRSYRFKSDVRKALAGNGIAGQGKKWGGSGASHHKQWGQH